jgi:hypothetical protein
VSLPSLFFICPRKVEEKYTSCIFLNSFWVIFVLSTLFWESSSQWGLIILSTGSALHLNDFLSPKLSSQPLLILLSLHFKCLLGCSVVIPRDKINANRQFLSLNFVHLCCLNYAWIVKNRIMIMNL